MSLSGQSRAVPQLSHNLQWPKADKWHKVYSDSFYSVRAIVSEQPYFYTTKLTN